MSICKECKTTEAKKWYGKLEGDRVCNKCYLKARSESTQEARKVKYANDPEYRARMQESIKKTRIKVKDSRYVRVRKKKDQMSDHEIALAAATKKRSREKNKEKIKTDNVKYHADHYQRNKSAVRADNDAFKRTVPGQYSGLKTSARRREIPFLMSLGEYGILRAGPCYYCVGPLEETGGCIDRLNSNGPYATHNCVPCCVECNYLKRDILTPKQTGLAALALKAYRAGLLEVPIPKCEPCTPPMGGKQYNKVLLTAAKRSIEISLTREQYWTLVSSTCYYCGHGLPTLSYGLDRLDPEFGYTLANSVPCCAFCNAVKSNRFTEEEMLVIAEAMAGEMANVSYSTPINDTVSMGMF